jgi:hypothetical protein
MRRLCPSPGSSLGFIVGCCFCAAVNFLTWPHQWTMTDYMNKDPYAKKWPAQLICEQKIDSDGHYYVEFLGTRSPSPDSKPLSVFSGVEISGELNYIGNSVGSVSSDTGDDTPARPATDFTVYLDRLALACSYALYMVGPPAKMSTLADFPNTGETK